MIALCVMLAVAAYINNNSAEAVNEKQNIVMSTGPFTINEGDALRFLFRNPFTEETLQFDVTVYDLITGEEIISTIFDVNPGKGISRDAEILGIVDARTIETSILVSGGPKFDKIQSDTTVSMEILQIAGIERMTDTNGKYEPVPLATAAAYNRI